LINLSSSCCRAAFDSSATARAQFRNASSLVVLRYIDEANLSNIMKWLVRGSIPIAAILVPTSFFLSVLPPDATAPNGLIYIAYVGAALLAVGVVVLGIGLSDVRRKRVEGLRPRKRQEALETRVNGDVNEQKNTSAADSHTWQKPAEMGRKLQNDLDLFTPWSSERICGQS
jgi:hypothetical protein